MAWKEVNPLEERIRFAVRAEREEETFAELCREFGISRKTGYKWVTRYREHGLAGMHERSRRPLRSPNRVDESVEELILRERHKHRTWGPKKLRQLLVDEYELERVPAESTIGNLLQRHGLTAKRKRRGSVTQPTRETLTEATRPNEVWAADFKGWFRTKDGQRCDPLTISDLYSRLVLDCRLVPSQSFESVQPVFRKVFRRRGLPEVIRVDNGSPFGSRGVCGLSRLSVWWLQLGIRVEFLKPGHPEQNGAHERMHRTLKAETARPPAANPPAQQRRFDKWRREFNQERPHEAIGMQKPAQRYQRSARRYTDNPPEPTYPLHYEVRRVKKDGTIKWKNRRRYIGEALHRTAVGLVERAEDCHEVYFGDLLLGRLDDGESGRLRPAAPVSQTCEEEHARGGPPKRQRRQHSGSA